MIYILSSQLISLHDLSLTSEQEEHVVELNAEAARNEYPSQELSAYRKHTDLSAALIADMHDLPPDIDKIIQQHHERPDGKGFPSGLTAKRIHPLAALFIVAEDLILFLDGSSDVAESIKKFTTERKSLYSSGYFRKILDAVSANDLSGT